MHEQTATPFPDRRPSRRNLLACAPKHFRTDAAGKTAIPGDEEVWIRGQDVLSGASWSIGRLRPDRRITMVPRQALRGQKPAR